jgi:subtilisin family serine protease
VGHDVLLDAARFVDEHMTAESASWTGPERSVRVAVLDTGVAPGAVCCGKLEARQLDMTDLTQMYGPPRDEDGHGSLVAGIIHMAAPSATIVPIRCFAPDRAALSDIVYGLLLARLSSEPIDVFNLSFSVDHSVEICQVCGCPSSRVDDHSALEGLFGYLRAELADRPILVAAAGNAGRVVAAPAALEGVLAVGSAGSGTQSSIKTEPDYESVPRDFLFTHGGSFSAPIAYGGLRASKPVYGTSFSTALVTGAVATILGRSPQIPEDRLETRRDAVIEVLRTLSDSGFPGYDPARHGIGFMKGAP